MDLASLIRSGVALADTQTKSAQVPVTIRRWGGNTGSGDFITADILIVKAIVEKIQKPVKGQNGQETIATTRIAVMEKIPFVMPKVHDRDDPIDEHDQITLPDGSSGVIMATSGLLDPGTNLPYMMEIFLG